VRESSATDESGFALSGQESGGIAALKNRASEQVILKLYNSYKGVEGEYNTALKKAEDIVNARPFKQTDFDAAVLVAENKRDSVREALQRVIDACDGIEVPQDMAQDYPQGFEFEYMCKKDSQGRATWTFTKIIPRPDVPYAPLLCKKPDLKTMKCDLVVDRLSSMLPVQCDINKPLIIGQTPDSAAKAYTLRTLPPEVYKSGPGAEIRNKPATNGDPADDSARDPGALPFPTGAAAGDAGERAGWECKGKMTFLSSKPYESQCHACCKAWKKTIRVPSSWDDLGYKSCIMTCWGKVICNRDGGFLKDFPLCPSADSTRAAE
jgi:hypothetical protein